MKEIHSFIDTKYTTVFSAINYNCNKGEGNSSDYINNPNVILAYDDKIDFVTISESKAEALSKVLLKTAVYSDK